MKYRLKLLENDSYINQNILRELAKQLNNTIVKSLSAIDTRIKDLLRNTIEQQPEYVSLISDQGKLRLEFGISDSNTVVQALSALTDTSSITASPVKTNAKGLTGGFRFTIMPQDMVQNIAASYTVITDKGQSLPWLSWLLFEGTSPIVKNYEVEFTNSPYSRTGGAIMVTSKNNWRVPAEFAGTASNNWITRAIAAIDKQIPEIITSEIRKNI